MKTDRKIISMTAYVLLTLNDMKWDEVEDTKHVQSYLYLKGIRYANFLTLQLALGQFVPCDLEGNPMDEPREDIDTSRFAKSLVNGFEEYKKQFQQAKSRVVFEGVREAIQFPDGRIAIKISRKGTYIELSFDKDSIIEDSIKHNMNLTPQAVETYKI